jgi:uncharacterized protein YdhG (YjbR/CyaY superfamily)
MAKNEIDEYLAGIDEPKRTTLAALRRDIARIIPDAQECISYGLPAFRWRGSVVAGFGAFKDHLSYFPHSGSVLTVLGEELRAYSQSKGALRFGIDDPLPKSVVERLVKVRLDQVSSTKT